MVILAQKQVVISDSVNGWIRNQINYVIADLSMLLISGILLHSSPYTVVDILYTIPMIKKHNKSQHSIVCDITQKYF